MINNIGERLKDGFNNATDKVVDRPIRLLGATAAGIGGAIWGGYEGYKLMHDAAVSTTPPAKAVEVIVHVAEVMGSGTGSVAGMLLGVGAGVLAMAALPSRR